MTKKQVIDFISVGGPSLTLINLGLVVYSFYLTFNESPWRWTPLWIAFGIGFS